MEYTVEIRLPEPEEYLNLRRSVGWPLFELAIVVDGLSRSLYGVCIKDGSNTIGMGRVVGDGAIYFHIQDVVVHRDYQMQGVGKLIMAALMKYVETKAGKNANIGLMCSKGRESFYEGFGFSTRPGEKYGAGMIKVIE